jgi:hypothetical protein
MHVLQFQLRFRIQPEGPPMKHIILTVAFSISAVFATAVHAADPPQAPSTQQNKMTVCNQQAGEKKGDERKAYMKECLSAKADGRTAQQNKMKTCNADAKGKKGDERKAFMKECLSK